jgi:hypothetical protein
MNLISSHVAELEPSVSTNLPGKAILTYTAEEHSKREAFCIKILSGKPPARNHICTPEPASPLPVMADDNDWKDVQLDEVDEGGSQARLELIGDLARHGKCEAFTSPLPPR